MNLMVKFYFSVLFLFGSLFISINTANAEPAKRSGQNMISWVDYSLNSAQKYCLKVDGKPFYMTNIQIRLDLLRYSEKWSDAALEAMVAQAAVDGFNTVSIPVHWYEVEPQKDKFDWTILDEYLQLMNKYNLKMEMLWFGSNSGGNVQWLSRSKTEPVHLRTPDYVLYSPSPNSKETTSDYNIRRDMSDYTVDLGDGRFKERENFVLGKVMEHIAKWDAKNGRKHPIIGVQINNEVLGQRIPFSNSLVVSYLNDVASAVKNSDYVVWTRANCVYWEIPGRIYENEAQRLSGKGTSLDFVGIDTYRHHFSTDAKFIASMRCNLPYVGKNYRMIMETSSNVVYAAQMHLAALSGNNSFNFYSIESLYGIAGDGVKPLVKHTEDIRLVNKILNSDMTDIAINAHGYGLFVHNWEGVNSSPTTSNAGFTFIPDYPTSQGISILRSCTEIVLMTSKGGRFTLPDSLNVVSAGKGYFDSNNEWVEQGEVSFEKFTQFDSDAPKNTSISFGAGVTVRLVLKDKGESKPHITYQAEFAELGGGSTPEAKIENIGFAGNGYVPMPSSGGAYIVWSNVDGQSGGKKTIKIRYSFAGKNDAKHVLNVNGNEQLIRLAPADSWETYKLFSTTVSFNPGTNNTIRLESADNFYRIDRVVYSQSGGNIDELQVY